MPHVHHPVTSEHLVQHRVYRTCTGFADGNESHRDISRDSLDFVPFRFIVEVPLMRFNRFVEVRWGEVRWGEVRSDSCAYLPGCLEDRRYLGALPIPSEGPPVLRPAWVQSLQFSNRKKSEEWNSAPYTVCPHPQCALLHRGHFGNKSVGPLGGQSQVIT